MIVLYFGLTLNNLSDTDEVFPAFATFVESMMSLAEQRNVRHPYMYVPSPLTFVTMLIPSPPSMWSYAGHDEKVIEAYGEENNNFLRRVKEDYDPVGTFTNLVSGGFKLPAPGY